MIRKAKVMWSSIVKHPRDHSGGEVIVSFHRELDISAAKNYPPTFGETQIMIIFFFSFFFFFGGGVHIIFLCVLSALT